MADISTPDPYLGEIRMFAGTFAPKDWALCDGSLLNIRDYEALWNLIGQTYGGDGTTTFGVPDLRGRVPVAQGGIFSIGKAGGQETVSLTVNQMANHAHRAFSGLNGGSDQPAKNFWGPSDGKPYVPSVGSLFMNDNSLSYVGTGTAHENRIPYLAIGYIISLTGASPS